MWGWLRSSGPICDRSTVDLWLLLFCVLMVIPRLPFTVAHLEITAGEKLFNRNCVRALLLDSRDVELVGPIVLLV